MSDPQPDPGPAGPGQLVGAGTILIGGLVEVFLGVQAAGKSLDTDA